MLSARRDWCASQGQPLTGTMIVPGDKSLSHRALMLGAIADGTSEVLGFLEGADTHATEAILRQLGVAITAPAAGQRRIAGVGVDGLQAPVAPLNCHNAGTGMRLCAGLLAGQAFACQLVGDASLSRRPMGRILEPLHAMGAIIQAQSGQTPPLNIQGNPQLRSIDFVSPIASAQVKSAVLLAGLYAQGLTCVHEPHPTRPYTEQLLRAFGVDITYSPGQAALRGGQRLQARTVVIPGDFSSAAFFLVAATVIAGSSVCLSGVGLHPSRTGLLTALRLMGAQIIESNRRCYDGQELADLVVTSAPLHGAVIPPQLVPDMIDEFPALLIAAAAATGQTVVSGASELRVKESDRLAMMAAGLRKLGIAVDERPDGAVVTGGVLHGGRVNSGGDHRVAMAFAIAGQVATSPVVIEDVANVDTSFPGFADQARAIGFALHGSPPVMIGH